jgi:hypothetical protein
MTRVKTDKKGQMAMKKGKKTAGANGQTHIDNMIVFSERTR